MWALKFVVIRANYKQTVVADKFDRQNLFSADQSWIFPDHNFSNPDPLPP